MTTNTTSWLHCRIQIPPLNLRWFTLLAETVVYVKLYMIDYNVNG